MSTTAAPELRRDTLDLLYSLATETPPRQLAAAEAMDSKVVQVFAAASVVVGLAAVERHHGTAAVLLLAIAILAYVVVAAAAGYALWVRLLRVTIDPPQLWEHYWQDEPNAIKHAVVADIADGYAENRGHLAGKRTAVRLAIAGLAVEALAVGIGLLVALG